MIERDGHPFFDIAIVVIVHRILDRQIRDIIKRFMQVRNTVARVKTTAGLSQHIADDKRIITTVEKVPFAMLRFSDEHKGEKYGIIIDEAHRGQGGRKGPRMNLTVSAQTSVDDADNEDKINAMMERCRLSQSTSCFAFTAMPEIKALEAFDGHLC